jgi:hypothetical protein|tara:strand:+ start:323 stop:643 length:321 start_codon:yes stop_codon:yes gene_type:complete
MKMMIDIFAKKLLTNNLLIIPIVVLIIALYPFDSKFYMLVKIIVFIFGIAVYVGLPDNMKREKYTFLVSAIIYNPIFPLYLGTRFIWIPINLLVLYFFWKLRKNMK